MSRDLVVGDYVRIRDPTELVMIGELQSVGASEWLGPDALVAWINGRHEWVHIELLQYVPPLVALAYQVVDQ